VFSLPFSGAATAHFSFEMTMESEGERIDADRGAPLQPAPQVAAVGVSGVGPEAQQPAGGQLLDGLQSLGQASGDRGGVEAEELAHRGP
jgi:hypothetical protein